MTNDTRPTIADVARRAGVSKGLVSFALNGRAGVAPDTRDRILAVAADMGFSPSLRARSLSVGRAFACGLVIGRSPDVIAADPFFPSFIAGVEDEFSVSGQVLVLAAATPGRHEEETYRGLVADRRVDGVILSDLRAGDPRIALVAELGIAAVTLGVPDVDSPFTSVSVDDGAGIRLAVDHLADLGHTDIAHVAGPTAMLHGRSRTAAFEARRLQTAASGPGSCRPTSVRPTAPGPRMRCSTPTCLRRRSSTRTTTWPSPASVVRSAAGWSCPATCRSPGSTTPRSAATSSRPSPVSPPTRGAGGPPPPLARAGRHHGRCCRGPRFA